MDFPQNVAILCVILSGVKISLFFQEKKVFTPPPPLLRPLPGYLSLTIALSASTLFSGSWNKRCPMCGWIQDSRGYQIPFCGFAEFQIIWGAHKLWAPEIMAPGFQSIAEFRSPWAEFWTSKPRILDSSKQTNKQTNTPKKRIPFPESRNPESVAQWRRAWLELAKILSPRY